MRESFTAKETLKEMLIGIVLFGLIVCIIGIWFVNEILLFCTGLWIGIGIACFAAWHMWYHLNLGMQMGEGATKYMLSQNILRYGLIVICYGVVCITKVGNPVAAFIGIMGLKMGAYLQPFVHKMIEKIQRR